MHRCPPAGALPPEWSSLSSLEVLTLGLNQITGTLPAAAWANLTALRWLDVGGNLLAGQLPGDWGGMASLTVA